jgi:hypothetical protein
MVESGPEPSDDRWFLRDWITAIALFAATAGGIFWQNAHVAVLWDISYILNVATRIAGGQLPYRDFPLAQAPLTFFVQAAIVRLTGRVFFHHVVYVATIGGLSTVLTWRIALATLRRRIAAAWPVSLLLAAPLIFLSVYSIMPNPEYDADCAFWILVAVWALQRIDSSSHLSYHPGRRSPQRPESKDLRLSFDESQPFQPSAKIQGVSRPWHPMLRSFFTGVALVIPLFFKQNMGLPFLLACLFAVLLVHIAARFRHKQPSDAAGLEPSIALSILTGVLTALLMAALALRLTMGLGNYFYWTVTYAGQRRLPGMDLMLGVYRYPALAWMLPCSIAGLVLLRFGTGSHRPPSAVHEPRSTNREPRTTRLWPQIAAFLLLAAPFLSAVAALILYSDDADSRGDSFLMIWPAVLVLGAAIALVNMVRCWRSPSLRALLPLVLLAAINGTLMSQQLWGSTYGIWPLLVLLLAEMLTFLDEFAIRAGVPCPIHSPALGRMGGMPTLFAPAFAVFVSVALLVCGAFYMTSEERLSYVKLPDGPTLHSAFPVLAGMSTPGPFLLDLDELLRYAQTNIPFDDKVMLMPGEDPFFFATGRAQPFPTTIWDHTCLPYSPGQIAGLARSLRIRWLIVKTDLQLNEDSTPDRAATMDLLMKEFTLAAHLRGYDVYKAKSES